MIRIIIVDDEILSRIGLQSFLDGKEGIVVSGIFGEAEEALHFLEENMVDVVLTDIEMAEMDGLEFIREIRERQLALGVIIVSCHEDFSYAQRAISIGTDSYILKHSVTEKSLIQEVKNVYEKTVGKETEKKKAETEEKKEKQIRRQCIYRIGVLQLNGRSMEQPEGSEMLVHLLEEIVNRYQMGTLFSPYNREIFILFQMDGQSSKEERRKLLEHWLRLLQNNISQYLTGAVVIGISQEFEELPKTRKEYQHAVLAAEQYFFHPEQNVFFYKRPTVSNALGIFETKDFLEEQWLERFSRELEQWLELSGEQQLSVTVVKNIFFQNMRQMMHYILSGYHFEEHFREKWRQDTELIAFISSAASSVELKDRAVEYMKGFQAAAFRAGVQNPLIEVLNYIDRHLDGKLTLLELAQLSCMSVPSFCKKFKEQTGMTVMQYINEKRVACAASLLKQSQYSLDEIAALAGFSNSNYLLRVFKKSTGKTIGQFRKQYGLRE
ncbi:MAG: response regulator [Blautia sp.]|nr:response regulator [Blautia sp.]MDY2898200.1 response regulator [Candidatus Limivivens sp.]